MDDPATAALVGIIANHNYVADNAAGDQTTPAALDNYGKSLWETEVSKLSGSDSSMSDALYWAGRVHLFLTAAEVNAWHYWWLCAYMTSNEGLCDTNDVPAKRMYTLGNFSRFVRPGYYRIGVSNQSGPLRVSAYKNLTNGNFAIVAINSTSSNVTQVFHLSGFWVNTPMSPWLTSESVSLAAQTPVPVSGSGFTNIIPAMSVVTLTGQAAPVGVPALTSIELGGGQVILTATGALGPDYTLLSSTNLMNWQPLLTTNPTVTPFALIDTNRLDPARFYRLQLGP